MGGRLGRRMVRGWLAWWFLVKKVPCIFSSHKYNLHIYIYMTIKNLLPTPSFLDPTPPQKIREIFMIFLLCSDTDGGWL